MTMRRLFFTVCLAAAAAMLTGCGSLRISASTWRSSRLPRFVLPETAPNPAPETRNVEAPPAVIDAADAADAGDAGDAESASRVLKKGDQVIVFVHGPVPEEYPEVIDDRGNVSLPLIGSIRVSEMTTSAAEEKIKKLYVDKKFYKKDQINIVIVPPEGEFSVTGHVYRPAKYPFTRNPTLMQAIAEAGGFTDWGRRSKVEVNRKGKILKFNTIRISDGKDDDPVIQNGDVITILRKIW